MLSGETGDDIIYGGDGGEYVYGGIGNVVAYGEAGNDSFVVRASSGVMVVQDFTAGGAENQVRFAADTGLRSLSKVQTASTYCAGMNTTIVTVDVDTAIWLLGVNTAQLTAGDVVFV